MCKYDSDLIIKYRDSIISKEEKDKFELHMLNCEACRSKVALDKEFINFLKAENSTAKNLNKIQVMSNIDLNKYSSGKGNFMIKLQKWKLMSIKVAAISIICIGGLSLAHISPIRKGFKTLTLSVLNKQIRVNDNASAGSSDKSELNDNASAGSSDKSELNNNVSVNTSDESEPNLSLGETLASPVPNINPKDILPNYVGLDELPENYTIDDAKNDGCVVFEDFHLISGEKQWNNFIESTQNGQAGSIRLVKDYPEDSIIYITDLLFDGSSYYVVDEDEPTQQYKYLNHYPAANLDRYILTDIKDISYEELERRMLSSLSYEGVRVRIIYLNINVK